MPRKLVVCFDGTWSVPDEGGVEHDELDDRETNVVHIYRSIRGDDVASIPEGGLAGPAPTPTLKWYDRGVGTRWYDHLRGGAFGFGISRNIRQGYKFLVDHYEPGDEIYVFGFSRGAYSARSLVGLIRNCGLVRRDLAPAGDVDDNPIIVDAYQLYRTRDGSADTDLAVDFRRRHGQPGVRIKVLGVWDTVGALGVPLKRVGLWSAKHYEFHDTRLCGLVDNAFHALALDEHRPDYQTTLWTGTPAPGQRVEQAWFAGAHSDVGGGSRGTRLAQVSLRWMQERAALGGAGLALDPAQIPGEPSPEVARDPITDSFSKFGRGLYKLFRDRFLRPVGGSAYETLHPTLRARLTEDPGYRPHNPGIDALQGPPSSVTPA